MALLLKILTILVFILKSRHNGMLSSLGDSQSDVINFCLHKVYWKKDETKISSMAKRQEASF